MTNVLSHALEYASRGLRVIPIAPGEKFPKGIKGWESLGTTDLEQIRAWWTGPHAGWGVGILGGRTRSGRQIFILDLDEHSPEASGADTLADLEAEHGPLPDTVTVHTPSGGRHLYFYSPVEIRNDAGKRLGPGLDIRGEGGMCLAPPTQHPDGGTYTADLEHGFDRPPAEAPTWLINLLTYTPKQVDTQRPTTTGNLPSDRYNASVNFADLLTADGWTYSHSDRNGATYWRRPGKDRGGISASLDAVAPGVLNIFSTNAPIPQGGYTAFGYTAATRHQGDWKALSQALRTANPDILTAPPTPTPTSPAEPTADDDNYLLNQLVNWPTFWTQEHQTEDWIAKPLIARGRQTALYAEAKSGKSWITLNVVAALATGTPILGQPAQPPVHVLYLDYEMTENDLYERLDEFGYGPEHDLTHLHYALIPSLPPLNSHHGAHAVLRLAQLCNAQVVIVDTTGRAVEGEENSADTYRDFARTTGLELKRAGIALIRTDHAGKDSSRGQRGSSAKNDDVDLVYRIRKTEQGVQLIRTHSRISWAPQTVDLIVDDLGDTTTIRLATPIDPGYTTEQIALAHQLEHLGIPRTHTLNDIADQAKQLGIKARRKTILAAAKAYKAMRDPLEARDEKTKLPGTTTGTEPKSNREPVSGTTGTTPTKPIPATGNQYGNQSGTSTPDNGNHSATRSVAGGTRSNPEQQTNPDELDW